jgi:hypothetical protein
MNNLREWQITNTAAGIRSQIMELGETEEPLPLRNLAQIEMEFLSLVCC